jgi:hypothetical protein
MEHTWTTVPNGLMNTGKIEVLGGAGTTNSSISMLVEKFHLIQEQLKNIMEHTWTTVPNGMKHSKDRSVAGAGTQTAALAFGGIYWYKSYRSNRRI